MGFNIFDPLGIGEAIGQLISGHDDDRPRAASAPACNCTPEESCGYLQEQACCSSGQDPMMGMLCFEMAELNQTMQEMMTMLDGGGLDNFYGPGMCGFPPPGEGFPPVVVMPSPVIVEPPPAVVVAPPPAGRVYVPPPPAPGVTVGPPPGRRGVVVDPPPPAPHSGGCGAHVARAIPKKMV
jgi:hypothetical protein